MLSASKSGSGLSTGYNLTRSLRFRASASAYLNRTFSTPTNNKIWTYSFWVKRGQLGAFQQVLASRPTSTPYSLMYFGDTDNFQFDDNASLYFATSQLFRDVASWYHIVVAIDTTQATSTNRFKLYVNGAQVTAFSSTTYPAQNYNTQLNTASSHAIGKGGVFTTNYLDGYLTEVNFIDGQALTPSSFGSTNALTGVWQPARYTGTYGTNGFYLPFTDNSALTTSSNVGLGKDFSGNGNYWTTNNISITAGVTYDSMTDVPTLTSATAANFAVLNPLDYSNGAPINGNLVLSNSASTNYYGARATFGLSSGKWYWEQTIVTLSTQNANNAQIDGGVCLSTYTLSSGIGSAGCWGFQNSNGSATNSWKFDNGTGTNTYTVFGASDIAGFALDMGAGTLAVYRNNTLQFTCSTSLAGNTVFPVGWAYAASGQSASCAINFGQQPFTYTPPTGFVALNCYNLPTSTILAGNKVMDATLYTGTGASLSVTNAGAFKPDLVWVKSRSAATDHKLTDSVRGATKGLVSDSTAAETTDTNGLTAFNSNGWTLGTDTTYNNSGATYVGWQWQAGQGSTSSNTNGSITSTVSVNASAGFSVVTYTGNLTAAGNSTIGHGLGVAPSLVISKRRSNTSPWVVQHTSLSADNYLELNATTATQNSVSVGGGSLPKPTSSVFYGSWLTGLNINGDTFVAYCWTPIAGYSAFGSYTGNGSTDGPFVYCGLLPRFLLIKRTDTTASWRIFDTARDPVNVEGYELYPNLSNAESAFFATLDGLSNGFKIRASDVAYNASGGTYIFAAFASNPFKNSLAR